MLEPSNTSDRPPDYPAQVGDAPPPPRSARQAGSKPQDSDEPQEAQAPGAAMGSPQTRQSAARPARRRSQRSTRTSSNVSLRPAAAGLSELTSVSAEGRRTGRRRAGASKSKSNCSAVAVMRRS